MPVEIIPHVWLGDYKDAEHLSLCTTLVVNCTRDIPFFGEYTSNIRIPVDDLDDPQEQQIMLAHWTETDIFQQMLNHIMQSKDILVQCQMGRKRSAATIAAFLMTSGMSIDDVMKHIRSKKREAFFPKASFQQALSQFSRRSSPVHDSAPLDPERFVQIDHV